MVTINSNPFDGDRVKPTMTGAELRNLPLPPIAADEDLYKAGPPDVLVLPDQVYPTHGQFFFSVPKVINAG